MGEVEDKDGCYRIEARVIIEDPGDFSDLSNMYKYVCSACCVLASPRSVSRQGPASWYRRSCSSGLKEMYRLSAADAEKPQIES